MHIFQHNLQGLNSQLVAGKNGLDCIKGSPLSPTAAAWIRCFFQRLLPQRDRMRLAGSLSPEARLKIAAPKLRERSADL